MCTEQEKFDHGVGYKSTAKPADWTPNGMPFKHPLPGGNAPLFEKEAPGDNVNNFTDASYPPERGK